MLRWSKPFRMSDLLEDQIHAIPQAAGLYIWRRTLSRSDSALESPESFTGWLTTGLSAPLLTARGLEITNPSTSNRSIRAGFLRLSSLSMGGGTLTGHKVVTLDDVSQRIETRAEIMNFIAATLTRFGPTLYVGEAGDLRLRLKDHLASASALRKRSEGIGINESDLVYQYAETPTFKKSERNLVEQCLTHLLIAPLTFRAG